MMRSSSSQVRGSPLRALARYWPIRAVHSATWAANRSSSALRLAGEITQGGDIGSEVRMDDPFPRAALCRRPIGASQDYAYSPWQGWQ